MFPSDAILVIGAGGFIGQALTACLTSTGDTVIAGHRGEISALPEGIIPYKNPLDHPDSLSEALRASRRVIYLASASTPTSTAADPVSELDLNLRPLLVLLSALQALPPKPLLYLSSAGSLYSGDIDGSLDESMAPTPRSYHGAGKVAAEQFIGAWCRQHERVATIVRPSNVYGPGQAERTGFGVIPAAFGAISRRESLTIRGDGASARDYLYIDDLVALCASVVGAEHKPGLTTINAGTGVATSLDQLLDLIEQVTGSSLERVYTSPASVDASRVSVNPRRANELFDWTPSTVLEKGLSSTWEWFRAGLG